MTIKVAFIGAGSIAQSHYDALKLCGAHIVGVCTRGESGQQFSLRNNIPFFATSPARMIEACQPDALFLLTQPDAYYDILADLAPFNRPTFIEKPLGNTLADAEKLRPVLPNKVFVGLNRRFYSNIRPLQSILAEEKGSFMAQVVMPEREKDYSQYQDPSIRNHWDMLQGIHLVDLITHLAGPCKNILGHSRWGELPMTTTPQYTMTLYETSRQHRVSFMSNFDSPGGWRIHFFLKKKEIIISPIEKTLIRSLGGIEELPVDEWDRQAKPGFIAQAECFLSGVAASDTLPKDWVGFEDAVISMGTLETLFNGEVHPHIALGDADPHCYTAVNSLAHPAI